MVVVEEDPTQEDFVREMTVDPTARSCRRRVVGKFKNNPGGDSFDLDPRQLA